jgi:dienelactone hydrolase
MGTIILIVALVVAVAFATYCIVTKSNQERVKSYLRIGALVAFVAGTLTTIIQWNATWYLLAALLLIWAGLGAWTLVRRQAPHENHGTGRIVFNALATLLLIGVAVTPALVFPQHKQPRASGPYQVATVNYTYADPNRVETFATSVENRKVNVEFWYPTDAGGPYPLVVFSPGSFGTRNSNASTFVELASNGYVVCSIDHPYHSIYTRYADGHGVLIDRSFLQEFLDVNNNKYDDAKELKIEQKWLNLRIADIDFVLDTILAQAKDSGADPVYQRIDARKIGLFGHSLGGAAVAQVARERNDIGAVINLDADLFGEYVDYVDGKYVLNDRVYPVPILTIFADDIVRLLTAIQDADQVVAVKHVNATAPQAYEVHLTGTNHMSLTDLPLVSPVLVGVINASVPKAGGEKGDALATVEKMNSLVLDFFNVFLKGKGNFTDTGS